MEYRGRYQTQTSCAVQTNGSLRVVSIHQRTQACMNSVSKTFSNLLQDFELGSAYTNISVQLYQKIDR